MREGRRLLRAAGVAVVVALATGVAPLVPGAPAGAADGDQPTVSGPVQGGKGAPFVASTTIDLEPFGYREDEYFVTGEAAAYRPTGPVEEDGRWSVEAAGSAPYTTRILVRRPTRAADFSGTVVVEWLNVTAGLDSAPDWTYLHTTLLRDGDAWVGVSAQRVGVEGPGLDFLGSAAGPLKLFDPERYAMLRHPGDDYSFDVFTQVGALLRGPRRAKVLGPLRPRRLLAVGESQSAFRLTTYANAVQPLEDVYDGFLVHSRGASAVPIATGVAMPEVVHTRTDLDVPVLTFETETDLATLGYLAARQPDTKRFRLWEVAGTAHADLYQLEVGRTDSGRAAKDTTYLAPTSTVAAGLITCTTPVNQGPQQFVLGAAFRALDRWMRDGTPPARAPRIEATGGALPLVRDEHGNVEGGIRTAAVDAPVAALSGEGQTGSAFCGLFGTTVPLDAATLDDLYPTHRAYVRAVDRATTRATKAGFVQRADAVSIRRAAARSDIG